LHIKLRKYAPFGYYPMSLHHSPVFPDGEPADCPVERTLRLLDGRWRLMVLFRLGGRGPTRWGALRRSLSPITPRVLTATLRQLEADGLIWRETEATIPPIVTYGLTDKGAALSPVFEAMAAWGQMHD
jgi:DNA-binding HxlR family transcriptional regulator